jgi:gliding motility-associated lipoprotein GldH
MKKLYFVFVVFMVFISCKQLDKSMQLHNINNASWSSADKPSFSFEITDETALYEMAFMVRHTNDYKYNNLFVNVSYNAAGIAGEKKHVEIPLTNSNLAWSGKMFNNIVETYVTAKILPDSITIKKGTYTFTIENIMREDPLPQILQIGLMIQKHKIKVD